MTRQEGSGKKEQLRKYPGLPVRAFSDLVLRKYHPRKGRLLVAEPTMLDPNFRFTVVLLTEFSRSGAVGFILNRLSSHVLNRLEESLESLPPLPVGWGGPVQPNMLHVLHAYPEIPGAIPVLPEEHIYWGGEFDAIRSGLESGNMDVRKVRFFLGYSGWAPAQLNHEIHEDSWIILPARAEVVFSENPDVRLWYKVLDESGIVHRLITLIPPDPMWN